MTNATDRFSAATILLSSSARDVTKNEVEALDPIEHQPKIPCAIKQLLWQPIYTENDCIVYRLLRYRKRTLTFI